MQTGEKLYSIFAILFFIAIIVTLILCPEYRQLKFLLPIALVGMIVNIIFMFIVLRDIFLRTFTSSAQKLLWIILVFFLVPVLIYLPLFGFKPRTHRP